MSNPERERVAAFGRPEDGLIDASPWYRWGPYLSERAWGTVREDYSGGGTAWEAFPHEHARSRAYRWSEDGLGGICDAEQRLCFALGLWNGQDPILKERIFGLTGNEGNHGEDAKEYWWYLDAVPSHAWLRWRYHYPQRAFPYEHLVSENRRRSRDEPEFELLDTGVFDGDRYWIVEADYAKADPDDLRIRVRLTNPGPDAATLHVLPTVWFRNTWSWEPGRSKPRLATAGDDAIAVEHDGLGPMVLQAAPGPDGAMPRQVYCENETNAQRLFGSPSSTPYPKDGINDHVVHGAATVNPGREGTKAAFWYEVTVQPGQTAELSLRLAPQADPEAFGPAFDQVLEQRRAEADTFYAELTPEGTSAEDAMIMRQGFAGMIWGKQFYNYDVARWLNGDPAQPPPPPGRQDGRNARWRHLDASDIMSMPDPWEYPWFAAWDSAFHAVALAHLDPAFAKYQLVLLCREWFQHPNGAIPAYEWAFEDLNPPVQAWAAMQVYQIDGRRDTAFLMRVFSKLMLNFTWWVNREDADGRNLFQGGFLGLDNIGPIDRSHLPPGFRLEQSDATAWMAFYCLNLLEMARELARHDPALDDLVVKFLEHFALISEAMRTNDLWDEQDGFYYDMLRGADGSSTPLRVRSMVGVIPLFATKALRQEEFARVRKLSKGFAEMPEHHVLSGAGGEELIAVGVAAHGRARRILPHLFDEESFLSPYGLRALSRWHAEHPFSVELPGWTATVSYEPAESTTGMFGGNSNWRGPLWMPLNYLVLRTLEDYHANLGDSVKMEYPTGSGRQCTAGEIAEDLRQRMLSLYRRGPDGRRPAFGWVDRLQHDPNWRDNLLFYEYFHADNGAGLGAMHQTGWTGLLAELVARPSAMSGARR
ncbi:glucosidase [Dactylosporangium aurantiacum]|uniref:Glucosidase n=1 Tax=Dactylosporangium aurantiacum TaxID=35754 RepID=A0A9Q9ICN2_9ACTN|nr:glucosidase [Dactylosporangium aurantiacum]MDG6106596.1 glucosidase [Dactylosporangium aurantiacum]UWZ50758.1 glucosidase [Dactylosporangium aurantiacum]